MSGLVARPASAIAAAGPGLPPGMEPALPSELEWRLDRGRSLNDAERAEAGVALDGFEAMCVPASVEAIEAWLTVVALGLGTPPADGVLASRVMMVVDTSGDLPAGCWTRETRRQFARRGPAAAFFPGDGEVDAFLRPIGERLLLRRRQLERALTAPRPVPALPPPEPELQSIAGLSGAEREAALVAVRATVAGLEAGIAGREPVPTEPVRAGHLRGRALWDARNRRRADMALPPLPEPPSFDGYGC